jgi:DNA replication protein DnaC
MQNAKSELQDLRPKPGVALPDESQCPICGYFDLSHPAVLARIALMSPTLRNGVGCRCMGEEEQRQSRNKLRWQQANLPTMSGRERTLNGFQAAPGTETMLAVARQYVQSYRPHMLTLCGPVGVGKTHILEGIGRAALTNGHTVRYEFVPSLVAYFRHVAGFDTEEDIHGVQTWFNTRRLLLLDDLGVRTRESDFAIEQLTTLIEHRLQTGLPTVIATNQLKKDIETLLGDRLASRLFGANPDVGDVQVVVIDAEDYRGLQ